MRQLGVALDVDPAVKALRGLDGWMWHRHARITKQDRVEDYVPGYLEAQYLYGRSFFLKDEPIAPQHAVTVMPQYLNHRAASIYAGSNEVQRNIMAKLVLGM